MKYRRIYAIFTRLPFYDLFMQCHDFRGDNFHLPKHISLTTTGKYLAAIGRCLESAPHVRRASPPLQ